MSLTKLCRALNPRRFGVPHTGTRETPSESQTQNNKGARVNEPAEVATEEGAAIASQQPRHEIEDQEDMFEDNDDPGDALTLALEVSAEPTDEEITEGDKDKSTQLKKEGPDGENTSVGAGESSATKRPSVIGWDSQKDLQEAVRLLGCLLALNPEERITAEEALRHPFLMEEPL